ncbi:SDR family oxidoreductase [Actinokineospora diospyrosa]|uniref:3-oxoacyl-[acyl-carrier-protein] reductase n=1 Tax=Actinokineospora diospyrosa TaxID=103728 RepID=A0ABT1IN51_9PSEU|nr:SDR family oxidoreductase [Actinokineospora diospyrosa]MCP2273891.1 3-oxoacyl-[acyl-carrier-protein] reductase [Actinokineospora diospyrosa]
MSGRSVVVTGGNRGLGLACARAFAAAGDKVAVTHRGSGAPDDLFGVVCDLRDSAQTGEAFAEVKRQQGPVEVLVANAGVADDGLLLGMDRERFMSVVEVNLGNGYEAVRRVVPDMIRARRGRIVLMSSVAALRGFAGQANYAASKAGLIGMARSLAREFAQWGITVNVVAPGLVDAGMTDTLPAATVERIVTEVPLGRMATAAEVADAVLWVASPGAGYVTGAVIPVDGGLGMGH